MVAASFQNFTFDDPLRERQFQVFGEIDSVTRGVLRTGSTAINLCHAASGRLQVAYGLGAKVWDVAAGLAIAQSAGCYIFAQPSNRLGAVDFVVGSEEPCTHIIEQLKKHQLLGTNDE